MNPQLRIVTRQPMTELWRADGFITSERGAELTAGQLAGMLALGPLHFVVSNVGDPLRWISSEDHFDFWKREVKPHLAEPSAPVMLEEFPEEYCYFASLWFGDELPIILLEKCH